MIKITLKIKYFLIFLFLFAFRQTVAGDIAGRIANYPRQERLLLGLLTGHTTAFIDSVHTEDDGFFRFELPTFAPHGIYRIVMRDDRFLEFIFSGAPVEMRLDYAAELLTDSLRIIHSQETQLYYEALKIEEKYSSKVSDASRILRVYTERALHPTFAGQLSNEIARLDQLRRDSIKALI